MELISPLSSTSLDIEAIKAKIKADLLANNVITDIDYEGSNISILSQIMAYLVQNVNSTFAMNANQTNLILSEVRQNIIHEAQTRGYNITRKISSKMNITISVNPLTPNVTIPKWTQFVCGDYIFYNTDNLEFSPSALSHTIDIIEGTFIDYTKDSTLRYTATESSEFITLNYLNVEHNNILYRVKKSGQTSFSEYYSKVQSLVDISNTSLNVYEEYDPETQFINIWTSFANQGNLISIGDTVDLSFLVSNGAAANGMLTCVLKEPDTSLSIVVNSQSRGGSDEESNKSIKANAPLFYNTGMRTVSAPDYNAYLIKSSLVDDVSAWGGELIKPKKLGHVFLSVVPQDVNFRYLTSLEEANLLAYMSQKHMIATGRIFKHPNYLSFDIQIKIIGSVSNLDEKKTLITSNLQTYFVDNHNTFNTYMFQNKIVRLIESAFENNTNASVVVDIFPKLRISKELFNQTFDNGRFDIWIPNSPKKYYLAKNGDRLLIPENEEDLYSYMLNGWVKEIQPEEDIEVSFSGTLNSKAITYPETVTQVTIDTVEYDKRDLLLDGDVIGYFIPELNILSLINIEAEVATADGFIDITFSPEINIKSEKSTFMELGAIDYV